MPSWFHGINAVIATLTAIVTLIGAVVAILITLGVLGGENATPEVALVTESTVMIGQQIDILGNNLDLISGVRLTRGLEVSIPLTFAQASESQLTVTIPSSAEPDRYNLILLTSTGDTIATGQQIEVAPARDSPSSTPMVEVAEPTPASSSGAPATPSPEPPTQRPQSPSPTPSSTTEVVAQKGFIAFTSNRDANEEIYMIGPGGADLKNLTNHPASDQHPGWSPDSDRIAFQSHRDGNWEIYTMNADGSNQVRLTDNPGDDVEPAWSPDGTQIAFTSNRSGNQEIYTMNVDGSNLSQLTQNQAADNGSAWSPDSAKIAFSSDRRTFGFDVYVMDPDGQNQVLIAENAGDPAWSPDGGQIAVESNINNDFELQTVNFDGTNRSRITQSLGLDAKPAWSPDGSRIVFQSERNGALEIYIINADGSNPIRLTDHPGDDWQPDWSSR